MNDHGPAESSAFTTDATRSYSHRGDGPRSAHPVELGGAGGVIEEQAVRELPLNGRKWRLRIDVVEPRPPLRTLDRLGSVAGSRVAPGLRGMKGRGRPVAERDLGAVVGSDPRVEIAILWTWRER